MGVLYVSKVNHATLVVDSDMDVLMELSERFRYEVVGAKYSPLYKMGKWDGIIKLFNLGKRTLPSGLFTAFSEWAEQRDYPIELSDRGYGLPGDVSDIELSVIEEYMTSLQLASKGVGIDIRPYQIVGVYEALKRRSCILEASTGSGKSMIIYSIFRYITDVLGGRALLITPTVSLTTQMVADFKDYSSVSGYDVESNVHRISSGIDKNINKPIVISTFQSLKQCDSDWFNSFDLIMCDEGHTIKADSFKAIFEKATDVPYRLACTGTINDTKCDLMQIMALTGPVVEVAKSKDLIQAGQLSPLNIKSILLDYPDDIKKQFKKVDYEDEIGWLTTNPKRNSFISKLANRCTGTTLVLFRYKAHGKLLFDEISKNSAVPVHYLDGDVASIKRESVRIGANNEHSIIVASYAIFSTGINLPAIENIIIGHPIKSKITYLQSIGRGLRLKDGKTHCNLYDIGDNLSWKSRQNHTLRHFGDRIKMLIVEGYTVSQVDVKF